MQSTSIAVSDNTQLALTRPHLWEKTKGVLKSQNQAHKGSLFKLHVDASMLRDSDSVLMSAVFPHSLNWHGAHQVRQ